MNSDSLFTSSNPLVWTQPKAMSRTYELRSADSLVGHLRFERSCGSLATAEVTSQKWTFKRVDSSRRALLCVPQISRPISPPSAHIGAGAALSILLTAIKFSGGALTSGGHNGLS